MLNFGIRSRIVASLIGIYDRDWYRDEVRRREGRGASASKVSRRTIKRVVSFGFRCPWR
jgi:hypothetical protein